MTSLPTFCPTDENFPMNLLEHVSNGSQANKFFGPFLKNKVPMLLKQTPRSSFKKLIILTPRLLQGLSTMSLAKAVPKGIRDKECKRFALRESSPVPYVLEKDPVQEMASAL
jgi:hypothetical protein